MNRSQGRKRGKILNKWPCFRQNNKNKSLFLILFLSLGAFFLFSSFTGKEAGYTDSSLNQAVFSQSVVDENSNLIFYKKDCPYCKAVEEDLVKLAKQSPYPTFYIDIDTQAGQILKIKYSVRYASTLVTLRKGKEKKELYTEKSDNFNFRKKALISKMLAAK